MHTTIFFSGKRQDFIDKLDGRFNSLTEPEIGCGIESTFTYKDEKLKFIWKKCRVDCLGNPTEVETFIIWEKKIIVDEKFVEKYEKYCDCSYHTFVPQTFMDYFSLFFPSNCLVCSGCINGYLDEPNCITDIHASKILRVIDRKSENKDNLTEKKLREDASLKASNLVLFISILLLGLLLVF